MKKVVVSGDCFTESNYWPTTLFPQSEIYNYAKSGAGNRYIADSIILNIDPTDPPDYVFVLFGIVNSFDLTVEKTPETIEFAKNWNYYAEIGDFLYIFSGEDKFNKLIYKNYAKLKDDDWPMVHTVLDWINLDTDKKLETCNRNLFYFKNDLSINNILNLSMMQQFLSPFSSYMKQHSIQQVLNCQYFLEKHKIPYNFSFTVDVFSEKNQKKFNGFTKESFLIDRINWDTYIDIPPFEFALQNSFMSKDGFHPTKEGMENWAKFIQNRLTR